MLNKPPIPVSRVCASFFLLLAVGFDPFTAVFLSSLTPRQAYSEMPLTAEYTWAESETTVQLQVPLKGQSRSKLDVFGERGHTIV